MADLQGASLVINFLLTKKMHEILKYSSYYYSTFNRPKKTKILTIIKITRCHFWHLKFDRCIKNTVFRFTMTAVKRLKMTVSHFAVKNDRLMLPYEICQKWHFSDFLWQLSKASKIVFCYFSITAAKRKKWQFWFSMIAVQSIILVINLLWNVKCVWHFFITAVKNTSCCFSMTAVKSDILVPFYSSCPQCQN